VEIPVGINPSMEVRGRTVALSITVSDLAITTQTIWLGANVAVAIGDDAAAKVPAAGPPTATTAKAARPGTKPPPED
jgi:hypothetical protein